MLLERRLHEDDKISGLRNWIIKVCMLACNGTISRFSSDTEEQKQVYDFL